ncbi:zf-HC2 domain-containing protein [bacterium]|nr:zf-HC2 domain-containing protein [bacterium]
MKCHDYELKMEDFFRGNITEQERQGISRHLAECESCRELYHCYEQLERELPSLGHVRCPDGVVASIVEKTLFSHGNSKPNLTRTIQSIIRFRIRYALVGVSAIVLVMLVIGPYFVPRHQNTKSDYSRTELLEADRQVKMTLARVNHYSRKAHTFIEQEVMLEGVALPLQNSLKKAFKPIQQGEQS